MAMNQTEGQAPLGEVATAAPPLASQERAPFSSRKPGEGRCIPVWEAIYRASSPEQQQELLRLAQHQGLLYGHQLPAAVPVTATSLDGARPSLTRLLREPQAALAPNHLTPVEINDTGLDGCERHAVALALSTPDLFLLNGGPDTRQTRVLAEIIIQAAARGNRVLVLSVSTGALDSLLERVADHPDIWAVRCLGASEQPASLAPRIRSVTLPDRVRQLQQETDSAAAAACAEAEERCRQHRNDEQTFTALSALCEEMQRAEEEIRRLHDTVERIGDDVAAALAHLEGTSPASAAADAFADEFKALLNAHRATLAALDGEAGQLQERIKLGRQLRADQDETMQALRPLIEARARRRFWTATWWRALRHGDVARRLATIEIEREQTLKQLADWEDRVQLLSQQRREALAAYDGQRSDFVQLQVARRLQELALPEQQAQERLSGLRARWQALCASLSDACPHHGTGDGAGVDAALARCREQIEQSARDLAAARRWAADLDQLARHVEAQVPDYVNVVAATIAALARDPHFGRRTDFDLLVLEEAHSMSEAELLTVGARARRWIMAGAAGQVEASSPGGQPLARQPGPRGRMVHANVAARNSVFQRLWQHLQCELPALPYEWWLERNRLHCRLRIFSPEQQRYVERETLADRPDVELHILTLPRSQPVLTAVVFPCSMSIAQAKQCIYDEIDELAAVPASTSVRWTEEAGQLVLELGAASPPDLMDVELTRGVREWIAEPRGKANGSAPPRGRWLTHRITFEPSAGWDRERAQQWAQRLLNLRDTGRTAYLHAPNRVPEGAHP